MKYYLVLAIIIFFAYQLTAKDEMTSLKARIQKIHSEDSLTICERTFLFDMSLDDSNEYKEAESFCFNYGQGFTLYFYLASGACDNLPLIYFNKYSIDKETVTLLNQQIIELKQLSSGLYRGEIYLSERLKWDKGYYQVLMNGVYPENRQTSLLWVSVSVNKNSY